MSLKNLHKDTSNEIVLSHGDKQASSYRAAKNLRVLTPVKQYPSNRSRPRRDVFPSRILVSLPRPVSFAAYASVAFYPRIGTYRSESSSFCTIEASSRTRVTRETSSRVFLLPSTLSHPLLPWFSGAELEFSRVSPAAVAFDGREKRSGEKRVERTWMQTGPRGSICRSRRRGPDGGGNCTHKHV